MRYLQRSSAAGCLRRICSSRSCSSMQVADLEPGFAALRLQQTGPSNGYAVAKLLHIFRRSFWAPEVESELQLLQWKPTEFQCNETMKNLHEPEVANGFFQWVRRQSWYIPSAVSFSILINLYGRHQQFDAVNRVLAEMKQDKCLPTTVIFNTLIKVYGKAQRLEDMVTWYRKMLETGCIPDNFTFNTLMGMFSSAGQSDKVLEAYDEMVRLGCKLDSLGYEIFIPHAGKMGKLDLACRLFESMKAEGHKPNPVMYSVLIDGQLKAGRLDIGLGYYEEMRRAELTPLLTTFSALIEAYCKAGVLQVALNLLHEMKAFKYAPGIPIYSALVDAHAKAGLLDAAVTFYEAMRTAGFWPPPIVFACLIEQHATAGKVDAAVRLHREMRTVGLKPSHFTCRIVARAAAKWGKYNDVESILFQMQEMGYNAADAMNDSIVKLVDEKRIDSAWELFMKVSTHGFTPHTTLCRELLYAFLDHGDLERARQMLLFMQRPGSTVDLRTYCILLEFFMKGNKEEDEPVLMDFMSQTGHPAHKFILGVIGGRQFRPTPFPEYVKSFYKELERDVDFKTRRYFTNIVLNYLVIMGQQKRARNFWKIVYLLQVYPNSIKLEADLTWSLKIRYMSVGSAMVGVLCTLGKFRERILKRRFIPQRIKILIGPREDEESMAVKDGVLEMLKPLDAPFVFQDDDLGSLWCRGSYFVRWFRMPHVRGLLRPSEEQDSDDFESSLDAENLLLVGNDDMPLPTPIGGDNIPSYDPDSGYRTLPPPAPAT